MLGAVNDREYIRKNIEEVKERVKRAAFKSGRTAEDITVIAVTKTLGVDRVISAVAGGINNLGENRVQELVEKYPLVNMDCSWHLIGHLQTNKVKYIIDKVAMIHSLDRIELAEEIQKRAERIGKTVDALVQVNVAGEETKFGIRPEETLAFMKKLSGYKNIRVRGLMTVAPHVENVEEVRPVFKGLRKILVDIMRENIDNINMDFLSMGMSNDYEVAIEEGANIVRIGTAIFGARQYKG